MSLSCQRHHDRVSVDLYRALGECYFCESLGTRVRLRLTISKQECVYLCEIHSAHGDEVIIDLYERLDLSP